MKQLPASFEAKLASGVTTLCWCWKLERVDGVVQGFTDHDRNVVFDGVVYEAAAGFTASEIKDSVGLSVDNLEVTSALRSNQLEEADLAAGIYDDAKVEIYRVDWTEPDDRALMRSGSLGEVRRSGDEFSAEVRGLAHYLQQPSGRLFQFGCDADVGDGRCKVDLNQAAYEGLGTIATVITDRRFTATGLDTFAHEWFTRGLIKILDGAAANQEIEVKSHESLGGIVTLEAWAPLRQPLVVGQTFKVFAGCDKTLGVCVAKFGNAVNFRGFPHMPGNDFVTTIARSGSAAR